MGLNYKTREMVAVGIAIGAGCKPCFKWHYGQCLQFGASRAEMQEVIDLAKKIVPPEKVHNIVKDIP